mgnify:FL=1
MSRMWWALPFLALLPEPSVYPVNFQGAPFVATFNQLEEHPRLVGIFSPTCASCLQTCSRIREFLEEHDNPSLRVFILWAPFETGDNLGLAGQAASRYLADARALHFWDLWKFGSRMYSDLLRITPENLWGVVLVFPPGVTWETQPPAPSFWMQSRNLPVGAHFTKKLLEIQLEPWMKDRD